MIDLTFRLFCVCVIDQHSKQPHRPQERNSNNNYRENNCRSLSDRNWKGEKMNENYQCNRLECQMLTIRIWHIQAHNSFKFLEPATAFRTCTHHHQHHRPQRKAATLPVDTILINRINQIQCRKPNTQIRRSKFHFTSVSIFHPKF